MSRIAQVILSILVLLFSGQPNNDIWESLDEKGRSAFYDVIEDYDSNLIAVGYSSYKSYGGNDLLISRYKLNGELIQKTNLGLNGDDIALDIELLPDGNYLISGSTNNHSEAIMIKLGKDLKTIWYNSYNPARSNRLIGSKVVGSSIISILDVSDGQYLLKTDLQGNTTDKIKVDAVASSIKDFVVSDNIIYLVGQTFEHALIYCMDLKGEVLWSKTFRRNIESGFNEVKLNLDNQVVALGYKETKADKKNGYFFICDKEGNSISGTPKAYGGHADDVTYTGLLQPDGSILTAGESMSFETRGRATRHNIFFKYLEKDGKLSSKTSEFYSNSSDQNDRANASLLSSEGQLIFAGSKNNFLKGSDAMLVSLRKTSSKSSISQIDISLDQIVFSDDDEVIYEEESGKLQIQLRSEALQLRNGIELRMTSSNPQIFEHQKFKLPQETFLKESSILTIPFTANQIEEDESIALKVELFDAKANMVMSMLDTKVLVKRKLLAKPEIFDLSSSAELFERNQPIVLSTVLTNSGEIQSDKLILTVSDSENQVIQSLDIEPLKVSETRELKLEWETINYQFDKDYDWTLKLYDSNANEISVRPIQFKVESEEEYLIRQSDLFVGIPGSSSDEANNRKKEIELKEAELTDKIKVNDLESQDKINELQTKITKELVEREETIKKQIEKDEQNRIAKEEELEKERLEIERKETERKAEAERVKLAQEAAEKKARQEAARLEQERKEAEERQKLLEKEKKRQDDLRKAREEELAEKARIERENLEKEKLRKEKEEVERRLKAEKAEADRIKAEEERILLEEERKRIEAERKRLEEKAKLAAKLEQQKLEEEAKKLAKEEAARADAARLAKEKEERIKKAEEERIKLEEEEKEREVARLAKEAEEKRLANEKAEKEKIQAEKEKIELEARLAKEQEETKRLAVEKEKLEKAEKDRKLNDLAELKRVEAEKEKAIEQKRVLEDEKRKLEAEREDEKVKADALENQMKQQAAEFEALKAKLLADNEALKAKMQAEVDSLKEAKVLAETRFIHALWTERYMSGEDKPFVSKDRLFRISLIAESDKPLEKTNFKVYVNERLNEGAKTDRIKIKKSKKNKKNTYAFSDEVLLEVGINTVNVVVENESGKTKTGTIKVLYSPTKPNLYLYSIGIPHEDLKFTTNDAGDFAKHFLKGSKSVFEGQFTNVYNTAESTRKINIKIPFKELADNERINPQISARDVMVIFVSSHGYTKSNDLFLKASDFNGIVPEDTSINLREEILELLSGIPCKKMIFIDACQSGGGLSAVQGQKDGDQDKWSNTMVDFFEAKSGLKTLFSCSKDEYSYEDAKWENGAFTESIIKAISIDSALADTNGNKELTVKEIYSYISKDIPKLIKQKGKTVTKQNPVFFEDSMDDYPVIVY